MVVDTDRLCRSGWLCNPASVSHGRVGVRAAIKEALRSSLFEVASGFSSIGEGSPMWDLYIFFFKINQILDSFSSSFSPLTPGLLPDMQTD